MRKQGHYVVRHDRSQREFVARGVNRRTVEKRFPSKDYTVLKRLVKR